MLNKRKREDDYTASRSNFDMDMQDTHMTTPDAQSPPSSSENSGGSSSPKSRDDYDVGSRTRKRHRDDRPDENIVYQNTLNKLYAAQRNNPNPQPVVSSALLPEIHKEQMATLHKYWNLRTPPTHPVTTHRYQVPHCDDCNALLGNSDLDGMSMEVDAQHGFPTGSQFECEECYKKVCANCAFTTGARYCIACAIGGNHTG